MMSTNTLLRLVSTWWGGAAAMIVLVAAGGLKWNAGRLPDVQPPPVPAPTSPNARDLYNRAESLRPKDKLETEVYMGPKGTGTWDGYPPSAKLAVMKQLARECRPAFAVLRQGLNTRYQNPPARSFDTLLPYYAPDRDMARLLQMDGQVRAAEGDWNGAMNSYIDAMQLGVSLQHGSVLIGGLVGIACEAIGRRDAWDVVDHLTAPQARAAAARLAAVTSSAVPWSDILTEERTSGEAGLLERFHERRWRAKLANDIAESDAASNASDSDSTSSLPLGTRVAFALESPRDIYSTYDRGMSEVARRASLTWPAQKALPPQPVPQELFSASVLPIMANTSFKPAYTSALNNLLTAELALRAYRLEHGGAYPASLTQLVPAYLPSVPVDPFSDDQPLRYRLVTGRPLLYSIGPDASDDGGRGVPPKKGAHGKLLYFADPTDQGDLLPDYY